MQKFRFLSAPAAWLTLAAFLLGGGLIATHSHDGLASEEHSSVELCGEHDFPKSTEHVESPTSIEGELCPACAASRRQGTLDALEPTSWLPVLVTRSVRATHSRAISGSDARPPAPRGPPTV